MLRQWFALPLLLRTGIGLWCALLLAVTIRVAVSSPTSQTVMPIYLAAGDRWLAGQDLYDWNTGFDVFRNPPGIAALFAGFSVVPDRLAGIVWRLLSAGVFLVGLLRTVRAILPGLSLERTGLLFTIAALVAIPAVNNGQVNLLIAGALLQGTAAAYSRRWWEAAFWFSLGGWLKMYPFAAGLLVALIARRQFLPKFLLFTFLGFLLPFAFQETQYVWEAYQRYVLYLGLDDRTHAAWSRVPRDWTVFTRYWFDWLPSSTNIKVVSILCGLAIAAVVAFKAMFSERTSALGLALALGMIWMTAFGPATEANTYTLLAGVTGFLVVWDQPRPRWATISAAVGTGLLVITVLRGLFPEDWKFQILGPQPLGALLLGIAALGTFTAGVASNTGTTIWSVRIPGLRRTTRSIPAETLHVPTTAR